MNERINDKIKEIEKYLEDLSSYVPFDFDEYVKDSKTKNACEHCFEKIIEALADLAFLIIQQKGFSIPKDDAGAFFVLAENKLISENLALKLKEAKSMRNFIAHEYGKVNDELVFEAISGEIFKDTEEFIKEIKNVLK
jgi:uncharacterized protein YutE (UPF0331/DUF86 family)